MTQTETIESLQDKIDAYRDSLITAQNRIEGLYAENKQLRVELMRQQLIKKAETAKFKLKIFELENK